MVTLLNMLLLLPVRIPSQNRRCFATFECAKMTKVVVERVHAKHAGGITQRTELFFSDDACFQFTRNDR